MQVAVIPSKNRAAQVTRLVVLHWILVDRDKKSKTRYITIIGPLCSQMLIMTPGYTAVKILFNIFIFDDN